MIVIGSYNGPEISRAIRGHGPRRDMDIDGHEHGTFVSGTGVLDIAALKQYYEEQMVIVTTSPVLMPTTVISLTGVP